MSAKTSAQPGRRTPLSLSGTVTKPHQNKGGSNAAGNNANSHNATNSNKQDNKLQQSKTEQQQQQQQTVNNADTKENPNKKQQQPDKKQQQNDNNKKSNDKNQNGVNSNKQQQQQQQANENKQQQQNKDKQQNGNENKVNEKEKKDKMDKPNKSDKSDKLEKQQDKVEKIEKLDTKIKEDNVEENKKQEKIDTKKEEKQSKEVKDVKKGEEEKKEAVAESPAKAESQQIKNDDKKSKEENQIKNTDQKPKENVENMEIVEEPPIQQKSPPVTPKTNNSKANKTSTPVIKTPSKGNEKTPQKSTPSKNTSKTTPVTKRVVTTTIDDNDDIEMEPLAIESSPVKPLETEEVAHINIAPSATSTPGKLVLPKRNAAAPKSDVQLAMQSGISPERPRAFSQISGRKSIRPISDYTPSKFQCNPQFRESYRRINTELDATNTSMNVTVGSEVPNNLSFSFFGRGRKRDRTPPQHSQSAIGELQTDMEISPPKRARLDMNGFFSVVSSPLSLLRNRFSKATLQSSTPVKLQEKLNSSEDEIEVQNVSGVSVHEEIAKTDKEATETNTTTNDDNEATLGEEAKETKLKSDIETPTSAQGEEFTDVSLKTCGMEQSCEQSDIKITETPLQPLVGDPISKNKRCIVM